MSKKSKKKAKIKSIYQPTGHELKSIYKPWGPEMSSAKIILDAWDDTPRKRLSVEEIQNYKIMRAHLKEKLETLIVMEVKYNDILDGIQKYVQNTDVYGFAYYNTNYSNQVQCSIESIDFLLNHNTHEYKTEDYREKCSNCGANNSEMQEFNCTDFSIKTVLE